MKAVLQQALDALEATWPKRSSYISAEAQAVAWAKHEAAIKALRAAIERGEPTIKESLVVGPYLLNGMRFKMNFDGEGTVFCFRNFFSELQGKWVALVAADDDCHLKAAPVGYVPLSDEQRQTIIDSMPAYDGWGRPDSAGDVNLHDLAIAIERAVRCPS